MAHDRGRLEAQIESLMSEVRLLKQKEKVWLDFLTFFDKPFSFSSLIGKKDREARKSETIKITFFYLCKEEKGILDQIYMISKELVTSCDSFIDRLFTSSVFAT